jgi:hypothetical protein
MLASVSTRSQGADCSALAMISFRYMRRHMRSEADFTLDASTQTALAAAWRKAYVSDAMQPEGDR